MADSPMPRIKHLQFLSFRYYREHHWICLDSSTPRKLFPIDFLMVQRFRMIYSTSKHSRQTLGAWLPCKCHTAWPCPLSWRGKHLLRINSPICLNLHCGQHCSIPWISESSQCSGLVLMCLRAAAQRYLGLQWDTHTQMRLQALFQIKIRHQVSSSVYCCTSWLTLTSEHELIHLQPHDSAIISLQICLESKHHNIEIQDVLRPLPSSRNNATGRDWSPPR